MTPDSVPRRLAAILSADMVGYSRLMAEAEESTLEALTACQDKITALVERHRGRVVDAPGDNLLAEFQSAVDACRCAVEVQRMLARRGADVPESRRVRYRIGVHLGDVMVDDGRILGDGVNTAARLESLAEPGGICISGTLHEQVKNKLDVAYEDLGSQRLKNIPDPIRVFRVRLDPQQAPAAQADAGSRRPAMYAGIAVLAVAALWMGIRSVPPAVDPPPMPASEPAEPIGIIAVLPLDNLSNDPEQEYFAEGMTDALILELGKLRDIRVISRTSVMRFKDTQLPLGEIAAALGVDGIIEGSVLRANDRVRITTQLIDARSDHHVWAQSYERDLRDILALQSEVARDIAGNVLLEVAPPPVSMRAPRRVDPAAHEAYLKGSYLRNQMSAAASQKSVEFFKKAIALDPEYVLAYSALADMYSCSPTHAWSVPESEQWPSLPKAVIEMARSNAEKALELDPDSAEAHSSLGLVHVFGDWDWEAAEAEFEKSLELDPNRAWSHQAYGVFLSFMGRLDEALEHMTVALELDPLSVQSMHFIGEIHAWRGEQAEALRWWNEARGLDAEYPLLHQSLTATLCRQEDAAETIASIETARSRAPDDPLILSDLAYCYAVSGHEAEARHLLADLERRQETMYVSPMGLAQVYAGLNEVDLSFEALERAYEERAFFLIYIGVDKHYDPLRGDPRFADLVTRIGLPQS